MTYLIRKRIKCNSRYSHATVGYIFARLSLEEINEAHAALHNMYLEYQRRGCDCQVEVVEE